jgi:surfeit locus 1 family protein
VVDFTGIRMVNRLFIVLLTMSVKIIQTKYYVSIRLFPALLFMMLLILLVKLGFWQMARAKEKTRIGLLFQHNKDSKPLELNPKTLINITKGRYSVLVHSTGHFDNVHNFLLDNKILQHQVGYEVLTPFILKNSHTAILVNRGWIPQGFTRGRLPIIKPIQGDITIEGFVIWPKKIFIFTEIIEPEWPRRIQTVSPQFLQQNKFAPFFVVINKQQPYGFRQSLPDLAFQANRHYAYACQWFGLSLLLVIVFLTTAISRFNGDTI